MEYVDLFRLAAPMMLKGAMLTLMFAVASMVGGLVLGFMIAIARIVRVPAIQRAAAFYVSAMRGTPLLVQVFVVYYGLPSAGITFSPEVAGVTALSLNAAAYLSESLRGAILSVSKGQWAASNSLGLTYWQTLQYIILPQALRSAVPSMSNTLISLIKDTSLVSVITVTELMLATKEAIATTFRPLPLYVAAAVVYWCLSACFEFVQYRMERHLNRANRADSEERDTSIDLSPKGAAL